MNKKELEITILESDYELFYEAVERGLLNPHRQIVNDRVSYMRKEFIIKRTHRLELNEHILKGALK